MRQSIKQFPFDTADPSLLDREDRKLDDTAEGIDWDEIICTTQEDWEARRFVFKSDDYPSDEAADAAMEALMDSILEEMKCESAANNSMDPGSSSGHA